VARFHSSPPYRLGYMYKIINDLITADEQDILENSLLNENTSWIFNRFAAYKNTSYNVSDETKKKMNSFRHVIFNGEIQDKDLFDKFIIIPQRLGAKNIYNIIAQLQLVTNEGVRQGITHVDMPTHATPYFSTVYYVNNSDGPTVLYNSDGSKLVSCEHERGKVIMFDGNIFHHSSKPTIDIRCIVNFCWD
jgi:hypothetical protein